MMTLLIVVVIFFLIGLFLKKVFPDLCVLCFAIMSSWILGLLYVLADSEKFGVIDNVSLGILMGGSAVGSMYYLSNKMQLKYSLFKLPYILSAFAIIYFVFNEQIINSLLIGVGTLWIIFFILYVFRNNNYVKNSINQIIKCCKNW